MMYLNEKRSVIGHRHQSVNDPNNLSTILLLPSFSRENYVAIATRHYVHTR